MFKAVVSHLKEIKMKRDVNVYLLSTGCTVHNIFSPDMLEYHWDGRMSINGVEHHLYFTLPHSDASDSEIREGDWCVCRFKKDMEVRRNVFGELGSTLGGSEFLRDKCERIVASTNQDLHTVNVFTGNTAPCGTKEIVKEMCVPRIPHSFIRRYISLYNRRLAPEGAQVVYDKDEVLKITSEHEVIVAPDADRVYSLEEVTRLCTCAYRFGFAGGEREARGSAPGRLHHAGTLGEWLEEHL